MHIKLNSVVSILDELSEALGKLELWGHQSNVEKAKAITSDVVQGLQAAGVASETIEAVAAVGEVVASNLAPDTTQDPEAPANQ